MTFVLIHGGNTTGACWKRLPGLLDRPAIAPDLPGRPGNLADRESLTIDDWACSVIAKLDENGIGKCVLVGHSLGGLTLLSLARMAPERIRHLVFIACPVPQDGHPVREVLKSGHKEGIRKAESRRGERGHQDEDSGDSKEVPESDGSPSKRTAIREPLGVFVEPVSLSGLQQGIPCTYIKLLQDESLLPAMQDAYIKTIRQCGPCNLIELDAPHMAMITRPRDLASVLNGIV